MKTHVRIASRSPASQDVRINVITSRAKRKLSQTSLAALAGISRGTLSNIERGESNVTVDVLERIAIALDVPLSSLFEPVDYRQADDDELARRAADPTEHFVDARVALQTVEEAAGRPAEVERYSRAGRPLRR